MASMNSITGPVEPVSCKVISCATVIEEMLPMMPPGLKYEKLEFGLHAYPEKLRQALQEAIDSCGPEIKTVILGYGLCSQAVVGLSSPSRTLIVPRVDDCIALFLGSIEEYNHQHKNSPGTLYLTKGWIEAGTPLDHRDDMIKRYGEAKARFFFKQMIHNYTRLVFINTGNYEIEKYRAKSREVARELELQFEEIEGSNSLIKRMLYGPWEGDFVINPPGRKITFLDFRISQPAAR
jgi:hypothetical protein